MLDHWTALAGARILLVEDNAVNRELAVDLLSRAGMLTTVACDGQEALDLLSRERFDGVLMDCQMPVLDGYAATRRLRQRPELRGLPVIAMTANAMVGDREAVLAAGMNDHIAKPIVVEEMFATLARWVKPATPSPPGRVQQPPNGIDTHCGLANTGGNEVLYRRVLDLFRDRESGFAQRFHAARAAGDAGSAHRAAHDLKGEAGTLGMHALEQAAAALERACINGAADTDIDELMRKVSKHLDAVIDELQAIETARVS
jgi:CheY-like chemotaxis protein